MNADSVRARRNLRLVTVLALLLATVLTHWPGLTLGPLDELGPDKVMHMLGFGVLTVGVWFCGWFRSLLVLLVVGVLWTAADEWTQGLAIINRNRDLEDWCANLLGVTVAIAWILATRPLGGWESRRRRAARDAAMAQLFARFWPWPTVMFGAALGAAASYPVFLWVGARSWAMPSREVVITGLMVLMIASTLATVEVLLRVTVLERRPTLSDRTMIRLMAGPALAAFATLILATLAAQMLLVLRLRFPTAALLDEWYRHRSQSLRTALDLALIFLLAAWAGRWARRNIAARVDRAHLDCLRCDQPLTGLPMTGRCGVCPECGTAYEAPPVP